MVLSCSGANSHENVKVFYLHLALSVFLLSIFILFPPHFDLSKVNDVIGLKTKKKHFRPFSRVSFSSLYNDDDDDGDDDDDDNSIKAF